VNPGTARHATDPINALVNYCSRLIEAEGHLATLAVGLDPDLVAYPGHVSGVIDADEDGLGDLAGRRPLLRDANRLGAVQNVATRLGKRAFSRMGIPPTVAERAAQGRPIASENADLALQALGKGEKAEPCAIPGCDQIVDRANALYCSKAHRDKGYRHRKKAKASLDANADDTCRGCGAVLFGEAISRPCPVCHTPTDTGANG